MTGRMICASRAIDLSVQRRVWRHLVPLFAAPIITTRNRLNLHQPYEPLQALPPRKTGVRNIKDGVNVMPGGACAAPQIVTWMARPTGVQVTDMRLLIVEDNEELAELLAKGLQTAGYQADVLSTVEEAKSVLSTTFYAALILDLGLPDGDGLALLRELRNRNDPIPVLVLTARGGLHDRVQGLRSGADDYLVKPFALEELIARLEAQLRRPGQLLGSTLRIANLEFDTRNRQASIDDQPQVLSARETAVLELLMRSKGRVVSKKQVEDHIFGHSGEVASNAIEVYVHRLRRQLSDRGARVQVHTIRGVGYLIAEEK